MRTLVHELISSSQALGSYLNDASFQQTVALGSHDEVMGLPAIINQVLEVNVVLVFQFIEKLTPNTGYSKRNF